ncbi:MAG TPA: hypothetical protein VMW44_00875 [Candidatus Bathyarchaeia archaeon]|nr:hypothetical protein [Candidatus Bathyarchaeia archaeon]
MNTQTKAIPLLSILYGLSRYHLKDYCYPSQAKFKDLLHDRLNVGISIATLNRWLRVVEDAGYIKRKRRIRKDKVLGLIFKSTLYFLTYKGYVLLAKQGVAVWNKVKELASKGRAALSPRPKDDPETIQSEKENLRKFSEILAGIKPRTW